MSAATNANTVSAMDIDSRVDAAIELRRAVLTADPNDEFARSALVRGLWVAHAATLNDAINTALTLIESERAGGSVRAEGAREIQRLLTELGDLRTKWAHDRQKGALPPSNDVLERLIGRARRLGGGVPLDR